MNDVDVQFVAVCCSMPRSLITVSCSVLHCVAACPGAQNDKDGKFGNNFSHDSDVTSPEEAFLIILVCRVPQVLLWTYSGDTLFCF